MVSFLETPPGELPRLDFTGTGGDRPLRPLPDGRGSDLEQGRGSEPEEGTPLSGSPVAVAPPAGLPSYPPLLARPTPRIRRATTVQDGHSFGEQALYDALWRHAHPRDGETRIITIGYRRMSELARLTVNNCKANIQSLIQKLAAEEVASFTHSQGRTYVVYSEAAILQRRRTAGLTHYIKTRGVVFVDPDTCEPLTERIRDRSGAPFSGGALLAQGDKGVPG
jgi:hypothetical protein